MPLIDVLARIIEFKTGKEVEDIKEIIDQPKKKKKETQWIVKPKNKNAWFMLVEIIPPEEITPGKYESDTNNYLLEEIGEINQNDVADMLPITDDNPFVKLKNKKGWYPVENITDENIIVIKELGDFTEDDIEEIAA